jgi:hypothetical protein
MDSCTESPAITISTAALLETIPHLHTAVRHLGVNNFALTCQLDVQTMSDIIRGKCETCMNLELESIKCPLDECNKQDSNDSDGF